MGSSLLDRATDARHGRELLGIFLGRGRLPSMKESGTPTETVQHRRSSAGQDQDY